MTFAETPKQTPQSPQSFGDFTTATSAHAGPAKVTTRQPITRKGQRKPYIKATRQQIEQRIESARLLLHCGYEKSEIHRVFREFYAVEWRQTDRYLYMARVRVARPLKEGF